MKHEIIHALGFSPVLFAFYRDKRGNPLTARGIDGQHPYESSRVTKQFKRPGWKIVTMIVTPAVVREARRHFGYDSLEGAELEAQGGPDTKGSHWEQRVFQNEAMTGLAHHNPVISRVTLALLEDTGWYNVNYEMAGALLYGFGKGCDFAKKSCNEYMQLKRDAGQSVSPYCDDPAMTQCLPEYEAIAKCNVIYVPPFFETYGDDGVNDTDVTFLAE